jgi:hypothetical protein
MLLTDVWDACDYMAIEPPTHILLGQFLGYKGDDKRQAPAQQNTPMGTLLHMPKLVSKPQQAPAWMKNSPSLQKLVDKLMMDGDHAAGQ